MKIQVPDSARLRFELLEPPENADLLLQLDTDPDVMQHITGGATSTLEDILAESMPRVARYRNPQCGWGIWMVYRRDNEEFLGWILVRPMGFFDGERDDSNLEIGWRFKKASWGNGYATESAKSVMMRLIDNGIKQFTAIAVPDNHASIAIMKKLGMKFLKRETLQNSDALPEVVYYQRLISNEL